MVKKVLLITDVSFWDKSSGSQCRIFEIVNYLNSLTELTIVYTGIGDEDTLQITKETKKINLVGLHTNEILSAWEYGELFMKFIENKRFDVCIIEYIHNAYFLNYLSSGVLTILDAHDIISERSKGFATYNYQNPNFTMDAETEFEIMDIFDYIIVLTDKDAMHVGKNINSHKIIVCPHPVMVTKAIIKEIVTSIGFIGSEYLPNVDAIEYFIHNCWPMVIAKHPQLTLNIYGNVTKCIGPTNDKNIILQGYTKNIDKVYAESDIIVNPVRFGAGLKIKNIEALAYGLPLITTRHGAIGLETAINKGFLVSETADEYLQNISQLVENVSFRKSLCDEAAHYAKEKFGVEQCLQGLKKLI